jgi:hypothetical protein
LSFSAFLAATTAVPITASPRMGRGMVQLSKVRSGQRQITGLERVSKSVDDHSTPAVARRGNDGS